VTLESDAQLVARAREGEREAFEKLVRRHLDGAYAVALAELADAGDAEDAVQDSFITALERLEDCRDPSSFGAWLRQIVRNRARTVRRREKLRETEELEPALLGTTSSSPAGEFRRLRLRERLQAALGALTEVQRRVVLMHDLEGYRHREIATELELPEGTVRSHLFHARRALRARLADVIQWERSDG
jgi:RNA polymerase sigma-70 factor, ECF subfamily